MAARTDQFDLAALRLTSGEGRRLELDVVLDPLELGAERYTLSPDQVTATLDISRTTGSGYALRLRFAANVIGPCMRCLADSALPIEVDAREVSQPGDDDELASPYVKDGTLELRDWAHDALALMLPARILCRPDCAGLCAICGADLNLAGPDHHHDPEPDPRWAKLSEIRFDS